MTCGCPPRIVTDSAADVPPEIARRLDMAVIPCHIQMQGQTYREGVEITGDELFRRMRAGAVVTTSQPAVGVFAEYYRQAMEGGRQVIAVHLGSGFSGLHNTACMAAREVDPQRVTVVDSQQVSMGAGWLAIYAAELAQQGRGAAEILAALRGLVPRLRLYALIDDLQALHRGGRVNWVASLVGQLLAIKPIIIIRDNRVDLLERVRTLSRGIERLGALAQGLGRLERLAVLYADTPAERALLAGRLAGIVPAEGLLLTQAGSVIGAHAGPGALGFACVVS